MPLTNEERLKLRKRCAVKLAGFRELSPADEFALLAEWCRTNDVSHDTYGEGALIEGFERRIADLTGKAAAAFMPSGVMAQLIAIRLWADRARLPRFGLHPTSHLILHEEEAYQALFHLHGVTMGDRLRPMTAADLEAVRQSLACLIVELPIREAGGQLPSWDELEALKALARASNIPLHKDGARLWESRASTAGPTPISPTASPRSTSPPTKDWAASPAPSLPAMPISSPRPHANMMHLYFEAPAEAVVERRDAIAARDGVWLLGARPAEVPGWSVSELYVGDNLLALGNDQVVIWLRDLIGAR